MKNKSKAFSLIELSIVILIIGVLIAGVTQASRLVRQSKLTTAKTLTQSSPVNGIRGLLLWLEPTLDTSFKASETTDVVANAQLTAWYDANPQLTIPNYFAPPSGTATGNVIYKSTGGTNSLPTVQFADGNTSLIGTVGGSITGSRVDSPNSAYTIFYVVRSTNLTAQNTVFYNGVTGTNGFGISLTSGGIPQLSYGVSSSTTFNNAVVTANQGSADIFVMTIDPNSVLGAAVATPSVKSWKNGVQSAATTNTTTTSSWVLPAATNSIFVGNPSSTSGAFDFIGEISEIIIFDTVLKRADRQEVEKYLSKKYAIAVTQGTV